MLSSIKLKKLKLCLAVFNYLCMLSISVVIITKNEAVNIALCVKAAKQLSGDVIVADSGSTDATIEIAEKEGARVIKIEWTGYGNARNAAAEVSINNWILAIDADERVTPSLVAEIRNIQKPDAKTVYGFMRENIFFGKKIRFGGNFGKDKVFRFYNKLFIKWDMAPVHEVLIGEGALAKQMIKGHLEHYTVREWKESEMKVYIYARLNAKKYFEQGRKSTFIRRFLSPIVGFTKHYIILLGFLDGKAGFLVSYSNARCSYLKYKYLYEMNKQSKYIVQ